MVNKCCAPGCKTGYESNRSDAKLKLFRLPLNDPILLNKWIRFLSLKDFHQTKNHRLCELHFQDEDVRIDRVDSNVTRHKSKSVELGLKRLKPNVVPSKLPNCPAYLSNPRTPSKSFRASVASQVLLVNERNVVAEAHAKEKEKITCFNDFAEKIPEIFTPEDYLCI